MISTILLRHIESGWGQHSLIALQGSLGRAGLGAWSVIYQPSRTSLGALLSRTSLGALLWPGGDAGGEGEEEEVVKVW